MIAMFTREFYSNDLTLELSFGFFFSRASKIAVINKQLIELDKQIEHLE